MGLNASAWAYVLAKAKALGHSELYLNQNHKPLQCTVTAAGRSRLHIV